jgi:hypothetical protein
MAVRILLKKSWTNIQGRVYPVGTILQLIPTKASELIADKIGEKYDGDYPPKNKIKMDLKHLNNK